MNVELGGRAIPFRGKHKWDFRCSAMYLVRYRNHLKVGYSDGIVNIRTEDATTRKILSSKLKVKLYRYNQIHAYCIVFILLWNTVPFNWSLGVFKQKSDSLRHSEVSTLFMAFWLFHRQSYADLVKQIFFYFSFRRILPCTHILSGAWPVLHFCQLTLYLWFR